MPFDSDSRFLILHALRIKGFVKVEALAELTGLSIQDVEDELQRLQQEELALFREARALWQLSPAGRVAHASALERDVSRDGVRDDLAAPYHEFLDLNESFKELCGNWQLRDGSPNDHSDAAYDEAVIDRLVTIDTQARPLCQAFAGVLRRYEPYSPRLNEAVSLVQRGEHQRFTGVMCGSYHDVWMELHEDLILSLGVDRAKEGSF
jgi:hypothetical protein